MKQLFFIFHVIAFLSGFTCSGFTWVIYKVKKDVRLKYFILVLAAYMLILLEQTITSYSFANGISNSVLTLFTGIISSVGCGLMIYFLPVLANSFTDKEPVKTNNVISKLLTGIFASVVILYYILPVKSFLTIVGNFVLAVSIIYALLTFLRYTKTGIDHEKSKDIRSFFLLTMLFLPYLLLDMKIERLPGLGRYFPYGIFSVPMYLLAMCLLAFYYGNRHFKEFLVTARKEEKLLNPEDIKKDKEDFYAAYNITKREREIVELLMKGFSYNRIGDELVVSLPTVKSHVYNIYQKTGVKSKMELLNLMNTENHTKVLDSKP